jgi:hypothetical protein
MNTTTFSTLRRLQWAPVCASALLLCACGTRVVERQVIREQPIIQQAPAQPAERIVVVQPPPAPQEDMTPAPSANGYTWVAGHYVWRDTGWTWERGRWVAGTIRPMPSPYNESPTAAPAPSARWVPGYWDYVGNDWEWKKGHWEMR